MIDYLRLAAATGVVLLPGRLIARSLGQRTASATLAWGLAAVFIAWALVFTLHGSIRLAAIVLAVIGLVAWLASRRRSGGNGRRGLGLPRQGAGVFAGGVVLGWLLWHVAGAVVGDGLFHEARIRKLVDLGGLHLRTLDEFKDGGLHPGYAFPLWHGFLALVAWISQLDPDTVLRHEPSLLVPLALVVGWEAGVAVFDSAWAGVTVVLAELAVFCLAPGNGGSYATLALPGTASRQLLVPAAIALLFGWIERRRLSTLAAVAAAFGALTLVHPTYALFLLVPLLAAAVLRPREWRAWLTGLLAAAVPTGLALLWLKPIADETLTRNPGPVQRAVDLRHYASTLVIRDQHHFRLAAETLGRTGVAAVAALALVPVCALAIRRRWSAFALGGTVLVLALMEVPWLFVHLTDAVSLSQSRRAAGFAPLPFALAGGLALAARSLVVLPVALGAGIALQLTWPGDFGYGLHDGGPAAVTWLALVGGAVALAAAVLLRPAPPRERHGLAAAAAALLLAPVAWHGFAHWSAAHPRDPLALSPALVHELRTRVPAGAVVIGDPERLYRVVAAAPVYVVALPPAHVANTRANDPYRRQADVRRWLETRDPAIARRYGATWQLVGDQLEPLS